MMLSYTRVLSLSIHAGHAEGVDDVIDDDFGGGGGGKRVQFSVSVST